MVNDKSFSLSSYPSNLVIGIALVAFFLAFLHIGHKSMWLDETASVFFARIRWQDFWTVLFVSELNQGLYYFLLRFWLVFGESEFAVRSFSALLSVATVPVLYALASRLFGVRSGLIAALLISVNAFFIQYAQEARGYSLVLLLVTLSSYLFVRATEDPPDRRMLFGYVCVSALAVYAHFFAVLVLIAQFLSIPFLPSDGSRTRRLLLAGALLAVLLTPVVLFVLLKDQGQISWLPKPDFSSLKTLFQDLTGDAGRSGFITSFYLLSCTIALVHALATIVRGGRSIDAWRYAFIVMLLAVPVSISFGFSFVKPILLNRYLIVALPGLALLSGTGIALIRDKHCHAILLALLVALSVRSALVDYYPREKDNFRDSTSYVVSRARQGDGILFYKGFGIVPFEYYWRRLDAPRGIPESVHPPQLGHINWLKGSPDPSDSNFESLKDRYERLWVVQSHVFGERRNVLRSIMTALEKYYQPQEEKNYEGVRVLLLARK